MSESSSTGSSGTGSSGTGSSGTGADTGSSSRGHTAGAFDIRVIIAGLIGVYGVLLTLLGTFGVTEEDLARADGLNINLWAGLGMLVVAMAFLAWARWRPIIVPDEPGQEPQPD